MWWAGIRPQAEAPLADTYRLTRLYDPVGRSDVYNFIMDDWGETF